MSENTNVPAVENPGDIFNQRVAVRKVCAGMNEFNHKICVLRGFFEKF